nr:ribonuclease H-like domain-containing protein [Tanacetum cinerariifolium]
MKPLGYPITILNIKDYLGKFDGQTDKVFFVGNSLNSKAFRVFNNRTRIAKENLHIRFSENTPNIADISTFNFSSDHEDDEMADINNLDTTIQVGPTPTIHKDHPIDQVIGNLHSTTHTRNMSKNLEEHKFVTTIYQRTNHKDL